MKRIKELILLISSLLLFSISFILIKYESLHAEELKLTEQTIQVFEDRINNLNNENEKDQYIEYLTDNIIGIRENSSEYINDVFSIYKLLINFLITIALLQLLISLLSFFIKEKRESN